MKTVKLSDISDVIRSKNSGPYELTFDIILKTRDDYDFIVKNNLINKKFFSELYKISEEDIINIIFFEPAKAIKITIVRPMVSGDLGEADVYGAQQHVPLLNLEFTIN